MATLRPITLVDQVVESFVRAAIEGRFLPGDRVVEADIARELNVSRPPVREALRLLESQGIVVNTPYRGMRMMDVDSRRLQDIQAVRASLEKLAARDAIAVRRHEAPPAYAPLHRALANIRKVAKRGNAFDVGKADTEFHRTLCRIGGNQTLLQSWENLACKLTIILGLVTMSLRKEPSTWYQEHVDFLAALERGDLPALDLIVDEHIISHNAEADFSTLMQVRRTN